LAPLVQRPLHRRLARSPDVDAGAEDGPGDPLAIRRERQVNAYDVRLRRDRQRSLGRDATRRRGWYLPDEDLGLAAIADDDRASIGRSGQAREDDGVRRRVQRGDPGGP